MLITVQIVLILLLFLSFLGVMAASTRGEKVQANYHLVYIITSLSLAITLFV